MKTELFMWAGAAWCLFWGMFETGVLFHLRAQHKLTARPTWVALLHFGAAMLQIIGLGVFIAMALWLRTARELGL
jgi:hypothetical protein